MRYAVTAEPITIRPPRNCDLNRIAQNLGMTRSRLVFLAISDYVEKNNLTHTVSLGVTNDN
jgi:hypothetical protein